MPRRNDATGTVNWGTTTALDVHDWILNDNERVPAPTTAPRFDWETIEFNNHIRTTEKPQQKNEYMDILDNKHTINNEILRIKEIIRYNERKKNSLSNKIVRKPDIVECNNCGRLFPENILVKVVDRKHMNVCPECKNQYRKCGNCGEIYRESCNCQNFERNKNTVLNYNYVAPCKYVYNSPNDKLFFGFEIELENLYTTSREDALGVKSLAKVYKKDFIYMKHDGTCGLQMEIISQPISWEYYKKNPDLLDDIFNLIDDGFISGNTERCGLHFHVNKNEISKVKLRKLLTFFKVNSKFINNIARRPISNLNRWARIEKNPNNIKNISTLKQTGYKHTAINVGGTTVEFRIFRGTLERDKFYTALEFIKSLLDFTEYTNYINSSNFKLYKEFVIEFKNDYPNLYKYIKDYPCA